MAADAAVSAGVVIAGLLILLTGLRWIDPVASLIINMVIVWGTWGLLRDSLAMALDLVPANVDPSAVRKYLEGLDGVTAVHAPDIEQYHSSIFGRVKSILLALLAPSEIKIVR